MLPAVGRVLLVEGDAASRALLKDAIVASGHEALEAPDAHEAMVLASSSGVDLVVCETNPSGMTAPELRRELRRLLSSFPVPFLFVTSDVEADSSVIVELAKIEYLFLFHKPPDPVKFPRALDALVGAQRIVEGKFGDASFDQMLATIERGAESGILTAFRGSIVKKVAFEEGKITFCGSNDPRERTGHALIKAGLITEDDLKQALGIQEGSISSLTVILEKLGKATSKQMDEVVAKKFREAVLDFYLWQEGSWRFQGGAVAVGNPSKLTVELAPIRAEGAKRAPRWRAVTALFPTDEVTFELLREAFPKGFPGNPGDKKLVELVTRGLTLGAIRLELAGQDYAVLVRLAELVKQGVLEKSGLPGPGPMEAEQIAERAALAASAAKSSGVNASPLPSGLRPAGAASPPAPASVTATAPADTLIFEPLPDEYLSPELIVPVAPAQRGPIGAVGGVAPSIAAPPAPSLAPPPPPAAAPPPPGAGPMIGSDFLASMLDEADTAATVRDTLGTNSVVVDKGEAVEKMMAAARSALEQKDLEKAARTFQGILRIDPTHVLARRGLAQVDALLAKRAAGAGILRHSQVRLMITEEKVRTLGLGARPRTPRSRLGPAPLEVEALVSICPIPEAELLDVLRRFLSEGWIAVS